MSHEHPQMIDLEKTLDEIFTLYEKGYTTDAELSLLVPHVLDSLDTVLPLFETIRPVILSPEGRNGHITTPDSIKNGLQSDKEMAQHNKTEGVSEKQPENEPATDEYTQTPPIFSSDTVSYETQSGVIPKRTREFPIRGTSLEDPFAPLPRQRPQPVPKRDPVVVEWNDTFIPNTAIPLRLRTREFQVFEKIIEGATKQQILFALFKNAPQEEAERMYLQVMNELNMTLSLKGWKVDSKRVDEKDWKPYLEQKIRKNNPSPSVSETSSRSYELTEDDIERIIRYDRRNSRLQDSDVQFLTMLMKEGELVYNIASDRRHNIQQINHILLHDSAHKIRENIDDTGKRHYTLEKAQTGTDFLTKPIDKVTRLFQLRKRLVSTPPFQAASQKQHDNRIKISLVGRAGQETKSVAARTQLFTFNGELIDSNFRRSHQVPDVYKGMYTIDTTDQIRALKQLLNYPQGTVSYIHSLFNERDTISVTQRKEHEIGKILELCDSMLNEWGLAVEIYTKYRDEENLPSTERYYKVVPFTPHHVPPHIDPLIPDFEVDNARYQDRQRRRHPSHGKQKL